MIANTIEIEGTLQADGKLILDEAPNLPPGRVRVALQSLGKGQTEAERLPDLLWLDDSISAPIDLPYAGKIIRIFPRAVLHRLPELPTMLSEESE